jgi:HEAT repeat protein
MLRSIQPPQTHQKAMSLTLTDRQTIWDTFCRTLTNDPNPAVRAKAATAIGKLHDPKFSPTLLTALTDESPLVRQAIIQSLGQIGATAAIPELITALADPNPEVSSAAAIALGQLKADQAIPTLLQTLTASTAIVRSSAAQALGQIGSPLAVPPLLTAIQKATDPTEMNSLIDALTSIGLNHPASIELIQSTAKNLINHSTDSQLRQSAIILLGRTALADSIPELIALLQDPDLNVVQAAIEALGNAVA